MKITLALCCVAAIAGPAGASPQVDRIKIWEGLRALEITIDGTRLSDPGAYAIRAEDGVRVTATEVRSPSTEIAFVIEAGDPALADTIDNLDLARFDDVSSRVIVVTYGAGAETVAIARPGALRPTDLRSARPQGTGDLVEGMERALDELEGDFVERKILIVVGRAHENTASERTLQRLHARMLHLGVHAIAVTRDPGPRPESRALWQSHITDDVAATLRTVVDGFEARRIVTFPEVDAEGDGLPWDGFGHSLIITVGAEEAIPMETPVLPARLLTACCRSESQPWWWAAVAGGLAILAAWVWARRAMRVA